MYSLPVKFHVNSISRCEAIRCATKQAREQMKKGNNPRNKDKPVKTLYVSLSHIMFCLPVKFHFNCTSESEVIKRDILSDFVLLLFIALSVTD